MSRPVIALIDLDCFYAQVEILRKKIDPSLPVGVLQHGSLIAVNYPARALGVKRHDSLERALSVAPSLVAAPVDLVMGKVSLEPYRVASVAILELIGQLCPSMEKGGLDEVYLDLSSQVDTRLGSEDDDHDGDDDQALDEAWSGSKVIGLESGDDRALTAQDHRLRMGARIVSEIRERVRAETGFFMSAGIASARFIAKMVSSLNKPAGQTVILDRAMIPWLLDQPVRNIPLLGGQLGREVHEAGFPTARALHACTEGELVARFGGKGKWLYGLVRGQDDRPIVPKGPPKSLGAAKAFGATSDPQAFEFWLTSICNELATRLRVDHATHKRRPKTFTLHYSLSGYDSASRAGRMPDDPTAANLLREAKKIWASVLAEVGGSSGTVKCSRFSLIASNFPSQGGAEEVASLSRFLKRGQPPESDPHPPPPPPPPSSAAPRGSSSTTTNRGAASLATKRSAPPQPSGILAFFAKKPKKSDGPKVEVHDEIL
jgi:DNA polymerase eta